MQAKFNEERVAALLQDRQIQIQESEAHQASALQKTSQLSERLNKTETALQQTAKDFILGQSVFLLISFTYTKRRRSSFSRNSMPTIDHGISRRYDKIDLSIV